MTAQSKDTLEYNGETWPILRWDGETSGIIPSSESLGFSTESTSTANYRGRYDHFQVLDGHLHLRRIYPSLAPDSEGFVPVGARCGVERTKYKYLDMSSLPVECWYEYMTQFPPEEAECWKVGFEEEIFFEFDRCVVPFTGNMVLDLGSQRSLTLPFAAGVLDAGGVLSGIEPKRDSFLGAFDPLLAAAHAKRQKKARAERSARRLSERLPLQQRSAPILAGLDRPKDGATISGTCPRCDKTGELRVCTEHRVVLCYACYFRW